MARPPAKVLRSSRFASRRREVRRARQRRRRRVTVTFVMLSLLAAGGWMLARSSLFALERIDVVGNRSLSRTEVLRASGIRPGANMLSLDLEAVERRVSALALVRTVDVTKPEPSRVRITVTERTPAFVLETIAGFTYLDADAVVIGDAPGTVGSLPTIRALRHPVEAAGERVLGVDVANAIAILRALSAQLTKGPMIVEAAGGGYSIYHGPLTVRFGGFERVPQKISAIRMVLDRAKAARERLAVVDVRSPSRPAALPA